jgi:hypothetical protein
MTGELMSSKEDRPLDAIVLEVGRSKKRALKRLRRGEGKLMAQVYEAIGDAHPTFARGEVEVVPVVILYQERRRQPKGGLLSKIIK